jgi:peptide/nickel transport system substrate-binding protein
VYREGIVGRVASVTPLTARSRAELALVGLVFSGLVRPGPGSTLQADLAASWSVDETGLVWSIRIRDDARWHDGVPVTASDVVFTVRALRSSTVRGPGAASWAEVTAAATGPRTVTLTLDTPIGGFLSALTQPLLPAHLLADVPLADLATHPFATAPVGTGAFALVELDDEHAVLKPAALVEPPPPDDASAPPSDSLVTPAPAATPGRALPYLDRIELRFFDDAEALADAMQSGELDGASGLPARVAMPMVGGETRLVRYPTTTLSAVFLNLRPTHPELRVAAVRRALLAAVDRDALITDVLGGGALRADAMVPPASWAFDAEAAAPVPFDAAAAAAALAAAGWTKADGVLLAPGTTTPYALELLVVPADVNPSTHALATGVADAWRALGFAVTVTDVPAGDLAGRLREGTFTAAMVDVAFGLEPDLYPLLASSQVRLPGTNVAGYQDPALDALLVAARRPGTTEERVAAWRALLAGLADREPILPLVWRDEIVLQRGVAGPVPRLLADPGDRFWDVLAWRLAADR